jgi:hypothetical protein
MKEQERWYWLGATSGRVRLTVSGAMSYNSLDPLKGVWISSDLRQTQTWRKLSPTDYRHLTLISSMGGTSLGVAMGTMPKAVVVAWSLMCVICALRSVCSTAKSKQSSQHHSVRHIVFENSSASSSQTQVHLLRTFSPTLSKSLTSCRYKHYGG